MTVREAVRRALDLLTNRDRRLLAISMMIQMATSALDLVGVLLIGLVGALAVTTVQSQPPPAAVTSISDMLGLDELSSQQLVGLLALGAAVILLAKSIASSILTRRVLMFLANRQALVSARLTTALLSQPLTFVQQRPSQETAYALVTGAGAATIGILGQMVIAVSELALLVVLGVALLFISPLVALGSIAFFAVIAFGLQRALGGWSARVGRVMGEADIASLNAVQEALGAYREIVVANRRSYYVDRIQDLRWKAAKVAADSQYIGLFPKYLFEAALVFGGFALAAILFATQDSVVAMGTLALFLAAGTRVMPSLLRLQGATLGMRGAAGTARSTFVLAEDLGVSDNGHPEPSLVMPDMSGPGHSGFPGFSPTVELERVSFAYPGATAPALCDISLRIESGMSVGLVGRSGSGKTTLADVILGVLEPESGRASLAGERPMQAVRRWPGAVAYVPQSVLLVNESVRSNVALGLPPEAIDDTLVWEALERAHLAQVVQSRQEGLYTLVGEGGVQLSGGQRQRLGIARALYTQPRLLVLDEATSSLDAETESAITQMIDELEGQVTTIVVAHRLSTVRQVDVLVYLDEGSVQASGSFEHVLARVPALQRQARLMGLGN